MPYKDNAKQIEYQKSRYVTKRCPECHKNIKVNKYRTIKICEHCKSRIHVSRTLSDNLHNGNAHGVKLWVERSWSYKG